MTKSPNISSPKACVYFVYKLDPRRLRTMFCWRNILETAPRDLAVLTATNPSRHKPW